MPRLTLSGLALLALLAPALAGCAGDDSGTATDASAATTETSGTTDATTDATASATASSTTVATTTTTTATTSTTTDPTATTDPTTTGTTTGDPIACDPDNLPPEGSPCATDGEFCSPGCQDPCQFCNVMECQGGAWQPVEVFPAPCLSCEEVCPFVLGAACKGGPPDLDACLTGCMEYEAKCTIPFHEMLACIGPRPTYSCDADALPTVAGCEVEFAELYACIGF